MDKHSFTLPAMMLAPMRGIVTPSMVATVSELGGMGTLEATDLSAEQITIAISQIRAMTSRPFSVHLTVPQPFEATTEQVDIVKQIVRPYFLKNDLGEPALELDASRFSSQMQAVVDADVAAVQFSCGIPALRWITALKQKKIYTIGTATNIDEALILEKIGVNAIVAQGVESFGERTTFIGDAFESLAPRDQLLDTLISEIELPILANGGVVDSDDMERCFSNGASAVQVAGNFVVCDESALSPENKNQLLTGAKSEFTRAATGRLARVLINEFVIEMAAYRSFMLPYPLQYRLMQPLFELGSLCFSEGTHKSLSSLSADAACSNLTRSCVIA